MHLLSADIGGTNARFALYHPQDLSKAFARTYPSRTFGSLEDAALRFLADAQQALGTPVELGPATVAIAGPIENNVCRATNLPWVADGRRLGQKLHAGDLRLLNDFSAIAHAIPHIGAEGLVTLGGGTPVPGAPRALLGPGTGLGQAFLVTSGHEQLQVLPSEGSHADFAPRTPLEAGLMAYLTLRYGRVSNERVLSGQGLVDVYHFLSEEPSFAALSTDATRSMLASGEGPAVISRQAQEGNDPVCRAALSIFATVLGAVAGNLALQLLARGGVFIVGGIAPRMVAFLQESALRDAFEHKGRFRPLLESIPLYVVTAEDPGLLGAAYHARERLPS